jgi:hypothetical protein
MKEQSDTQRDPYRDDVVPPSALEAESADVCSSTTPSPSNRQANPKLSVLASWVDGPPAPLDCELIRRKRHFNRTWADRTAQLGEDPDLLCQFLDAGLAEPREVDWQRLLYRAIEAADDLRLRGDELRAGLELCRRWPTRSGGRLVGVTLIRHAIGYAAEYPLQEVYAAVRGSRARKWLQPVSWSVLAPLARLKAYDDRLVDPSPQDMRARICYGPPSEVTLRHRTFLTEWWTGVGTSIRSEMDRLFAWGAETRQRLLDGDAPVLEQVRHVLDRQQRVERLFRRGDAVLNLPLFARLGDVLAEIDTHCQALASLPPNAAGGSCTGTHGRMHLDLAVAVAQALNAELDEWRRRGPSASGVYRSEVLERAVTIVSAAYRVEMVPADVKSAIQKHQKRAKT